MPIMNRRGKKSLNGKPFTRESVAVPSCAALVGKRPSTLHVRIFVLGWGALLSYNPNSINNRAHWSLQCYIKYVVLLGTNYHLIDTIGS